MVREIKLSDKEEWEVLYRGYADFYKVEMKDEILKTVWSWLHDKNHDVKGIVYEHDNKVIGLAHYRRMPRPLRGKYIGFLDDIYVEPKYRGKKIGEKLIHELKKISKKNNWDLVRWVTHNDNIRAKSLYDRIAKKTAWDLYELK
jgi:ribosomal protein S18 acetylase RimI-like enzyme